MLEREDGCPKETLSRAALEKRVQALTLSNGGIDINWERERKKNDTRLESVCLSILTCASPLWTQVQRRISLLKSSLGARVGIIYAFTCVPSTSFRCKLCFARFSTQFRTETRILYKGTQANINLRILSVLIALTTKTMRGLIPQPVLSTLEAGNWRKSEAQEEKEQRGSRWLPCTFLPVFHHFFNWIHGHKQDSQRHAIHSLAEWVSYTILLSFVQTLHCVVVFNAGKSLGWSVAVCARRDAWGEDAY